MRRNGSRYMVYMDRKDFNRDVLPFEQLEEFQTDSSNIDTGATLMKIDEDEKNYVITYYNQKGIVATYKKRKNKPNEQR